MTSAATINEYDLQAIVCKALKEGGDEQQIDDDLRPLGIKTVMLINEVDKDAPEGSHILTERDRIRGWLREYWQNYEDAFEALHGYEPHEDSGAVIFDGIPIVQGDDGKSYHLLMIDSDSKAALWALVVPADQVTKSR